VKKALAALVLMFALGAAGEAQAAAPHCSPWGCDSAWHYTTGSEQGIPNTVSTVTDAQLRRVAGNGLSYHYGCCESLSNVWSGAYAPVVLSGSRTSSTSGYVTVIHDYKWCCNPSYYARIPRRVHQVQADYGNFASGLGHWRWRATSHQG
jgi:hypothetical protein